MKDCLLGFGGHAGAGGFSADSSSITPDELIARINQTVQDHKDDTKCGFSYKADYELNGDELNFELIDDIKKLEPFGAENKKPVFFFSDAVVLSQKHIGKDANHLAFTVAKDNIEFDCLFWKRMILGVDIGEKIDFIFRPEVSEFNGKRRLQLIVQNILNDKLSLNVTSNINFFDHRQKTGILDETFEIVKSKNGEAKIYSFSIHSKKLLSKFKEINKFCIQNDNEKVKTLVLFDCPASVHEFRKIISELQPNNIHIMKNDFSKNPDDYISQICGMVKYATNNKGGVIDIKTIAKNVELDEAAIQIALELLEKIESIKIEDDGRIYFLKPPKQSAIHTDSMFEIFSDEFNRIMEFKTFLQTAKIEEIEEIFKI